MENIMSLPRQAASGGAVTELKARHHNVLRVQIQSQTCYVLPINLMIRFYSLSLEYLTSTGALPVLFLARILTMERIILVFLPFLWN
jgi:hypothetical protein